MSDQPVGARPWPDSAPEVDAFATAIIERVADRWTLLVLELLAEHGELRFSRIGRLAEGISQKMLTQTLRQMERDGFVRRTVHPVVPPRVDYRLTDLGESLGVVLCGLWEWAAANHARVAAARAEFDDRLRD